MTPQCELLSEIHQRMHEICKEEGRVDSDVVTATATDLEGIANDYGLTRAPYEADDVLRERVLAASWKKAWKR
jgi:hypothetical protein